MLLGLGWPQWLTIIAMVGALFLTFKVMARAAMAYERKRRQRERTSDEVLGDDGRKEEPR